VYAFAGATEAGQEIGRIVGEAGMRASRGDLRSPRQVAASAGQRIQVTPSARQRSVVAIGVDQPERLLGHSHAVVPCTDGYHALAGDCGQSASLIHIPAQRRDD
jgi:hypothetical protein